MKFINIASLLALLTVFDYSSSVGILATATKTSTYETEYEYEISTTEYEWENDDETKGDPIPKPEENIPSPTTRHLRGAKDAVVNQFLSDGDGDSERELACIGDYDPCANDSECCGGHCVCLGGNCIGDLAKQCLTY